MGRSPGISVRIRRATATSTNPIASIFAWTGGLKHRGKLDNTPPVTQFAETLERVCVQTVEEGSMTKDLAQLITSQRRQDQAFLTTEEFLDALDEKLQNATRGQGRLTNGPQQTDS